MLQEIMECHFRSVSWSDCMHCTFHEIVLHMVSPMHNSCEAMKMCYMLIPAVLRHNVSA